MKKKLKKQYVIAIVIFILLYTLAGFLICPPLQCFPLISIYNFDISKIFLLSFPISIYHILYIFHHLDRFSVLLFQCPLFRLLHVISSNRFLVVFPFCQSTHFPNSWRVISLVFFLPDITFPVSLSSWPFFCFPFSIFQFPFFLSIASEFPYRNSILGITPLILL